MNQKNITLKQRFSVFELYIRTTFLPVLGIAVAVIAAQCAAFAWFLHISVSNLAEYGYPNMEYVIDKYFLAVFGGVGLLLVAYFLSRTGDSSNGKSGYTIRRLAVSEKGVLLTQFLYNTLCIFLYWAALVGGVFAMYGIYQAMLGADAVNSQTLALCFVRSPYIHGLLPYSEPLSVAANILMLPALGFLTAMQSFHRRRGRRRDNRLSLLMIWIVLSFSRTIENADFRSSVLMFVAAACVIWELYNLVNDDNDEEVSS